MKTLDQLMGSPREFPVEITLSSGDSYVLPHPDHLHRLQENFAIYPKGYVFGIVIAAAHVVSVKSLRKGLMRLLFS
jgi:hypothetical protein